jgi:hypothetical protein
VKLIGVKVKFNRAFPSKWWLPLLALLICLPSSAQWKWRDAQGRLQYTDRPPPASTPDKDILQRPLSAPISTSASETQISSSAPASASLPSIEKVDKADKALEEKKAAQDKAKAAQAKAEEAKALKLKTENCARAKEYSQTIRSGMQLARVNAKGEKEVLDDTQRQQEMKKAQDVMQRDCSR